MALGINTEEILNNLNDTNNEELIQNQKDPSMVKDILAAPFRGVEGAVQGVYNLADWATFDYLPDYDNRFLGKSETIAGSLVEGITQFVVPYGAISKGLSMAGKATKFAKPFMKVNKKGKEVLNWKGVLASEAATDFVAFDAQEERLSNLVQAFPSVANPITEYLAADGDDAELEGRFKNTLEGLGITGAMAGAFGLALKAHKKMKTKPEEAKKIGESMDFKQIRTVPVEDYSPAIKASKTAFTKSKRMDKNKSIPVNMMEKELTVYGEKGTAEELRWMGFSDWAQSKGKNRVTQKEVDEFLEENQFKYQLTERSGSSTNKVYERLGGQKGGDNYREFILTADEAKKGTKDYGVNQHYNRKEGDTLMHFRTTDRTDPDSGQRVLYVEEVQSDLMQGKRKALKVGAEDQGKLPLEDSYINTSMRMVMQLAAKEGYDKVSWSTPQQIASLYDATLDNIKLNSINEDGSRSYDITKQNGETVTKIVKNSEESENVFGKRASETLNARLTKAGDEIMDFEVKQDAKSYNQYKDKMVSAVNKVAKPFGGKVEMSRTDRTKEAASLEGKFESFIKQLKEDQPESDVLDRLMQFTREDLFADWRSSQVRRGGRWMSSEEALLKDFDFELDLSGLEDDMLEKFQYHEDFTELLDKLYSESWDFDTMLLLEDTLFDHFRKYKPEMRSKEFGQPQPSFSINLNDGMKKSVEEIRLWGLKTGDEAKLGGEIQDPALEQALQLPALRYLNDKEVIGMERDFSGNIAGETNAKFALERLAENGSTPQVKKLAAGMLELFGKDNDFLETTIRTILEDSDSFGSFGFKGNKQNIDLYSNRTQIADGEMARDAVFTEATLLHEITHAAQVRFIPKEISTISTLKGADYLAKVDELIASADTAPPLKRLLESYKTALDNAPEEFKGIMGSLNDATGFLDDAGMRSRIGEWYGLSNVDEFLAEAMSNTKFQNYLKSVKTGNTSLWDNIIQVLKDFLGVDAKGTLLGDTISNFADLVSKQNRKYSVESYKTPYVNPIRSRGTRMNENRFFQKSGENKSGITVENRGGQIAVEGTVKAIGEVETAYDLGEVLAKAETSVLEEMERTGSIGFYEDGTLQGSDGLKGGGVVQAVEQARRMAEMSGQKIDIIESEVRAAGNDAAALRRIAARMYTVESIAVQQGADIVEKAKKIAAQSAEATDADRAELMGDIQKMLNLVAAGSNLRRGFGQGLQSTQFARTKLSLSAAERRSQEIVNQYMASNKGEKNNFDVLINRIILAGGDPKNTSAKDMIDQMLGVVKAGRASEGGKFMEMAQNWFINSLLSGPRTMMKNGIGNMITQTLLQTELAIGGLSVDPAITRMVLKEMSTFESFRESMKYFLDVYSMKDQLLDIGRNPLENTANTGIPKYFDNAAPEETIKNSMNWFSENVVNIPAKTLMAMDEVFKQSIFRQNAKMEWTLKGMKLGIKDPDALTEYVMRGMDAVLVDGERAFSDAGVMKFAQASVKKMDDELVAAGQKPMTPQKRGAEVNRIIGEETQKRADMLKSYEEGGLGLENISDIDNVAARSLEQARYGTFTNDAGAFADLAQAMTQKVPPLRLIFPFIRTPVNILKFSFDRASGGAMDAGRSALAMMPDMPMLKRTQDELRMKLESRNPIEVARTRGKIATSVMINGTLLYMIMANRDFITGGGPKDIAQRKTLEATGWQKYSLKFGNKYASFAGLDPLGTHFGILVDIVEQLDEHASHNTTTAEQMFAAASISLSRNVTEKSYLAGLKFLTDAISEPDQKMERAIRNIAGGFVPNVLYQGQSVMGDTTSREVRSLSDAFMKKLPFGNGNLDPKRNILGEPVIMEQYPVVGPFNPSSISTRDGDVVFEELAQLEHGFTQTSTMLDRSIDMTEFVNDKGQSAYDRRLELLNKTKIRGRTLRQELEKLIKSGRYQRLSPLTDGALKSPRVKLINKVLSKYRSRSLSLMMEEFPEIEQEYTRMRSINKQAQRGASTETLQALLDA
jgi:hypothetical protein